MRGCRGWWSSAPSITSPSSRCRSKQEHCKGPEGWGAGVLRSWLLAWKRDAGGEHAAWLSPDDTGTDACRHPASPLPGFLPALSKHILFLLADSFRPAEAGISRGGSRIPP